MLGVGFGRFWASPGPGVAINGFLDPSSLRWADFQPNPGAPHTLRHHRHPPRRTSPPPPTAKKTERPSNTSAHDLAATPFNLSLVVLEGSQALIKFLIGNHILSCETHIYGPPAFKEEKLQSLKAPPRGGDVFRAIACPDKQLLHLNEQLLHPEK